MYIDTNDLSIYYEWGQDESLPPLLFISGSGSDLRVKPNQFDSALASAFRLLCYDQRGLGRTSVPDGDYTMQQYADDAAALLDGLGIDQIPVIGVSFGGMVAQEFVLRHPDRVQCLVLACTSSGGAGGASYPLHELHHLPPLERAQANLKVADLRHTDEWIEAHPDQWQMRIDMSLAARAQLADADASAADGAYKQLLARRGHDTFARLPQIKVPTLLAAGEFDGIAPLANMQVIAEQIAGSELQTFRGGHMFLIQDKTAYPEIIQWLTKHL